MTTYRAPARTTHRGSGRARRRARPGLIKVRPDTVTASCWRINGLWLSPSLEPPRARWTGPSHQSKERRNLETGPHRRACAVPRRDLSGSWFGVAEDLRIAELGDAARDTLQLSSEISSAPGARQSAWQWRTLTAQQRFWSHQPERVGARRLFVGLGRRAGAGAGSASEPRRSVPHGGFGGAGGPSGEGGGNGGFWWNAAH